MSEERESPGGGHPEQCVGSPTRSFLFGLQNYPSDRSEARLDIRRMKPLLFLDSVSSLSGSASVFVQCLTFLVHNLAHECTLLLRRRRFCGSRASRR